MTQNIYNEIHSISKSATKPVKLPLMFFASERQTRFSKALQWALVNGLVKVSPKTGSIRVLPTDWVSSTELQTMLRMDRKKFHRARMKAGISPRFSDPQQNYFSAQDAEKLVLGQRVGNT